MTGSVAATGPRDPLLAPDPPPPPPPPKAWGDRYDYFLDDLLAVMRKHGLSLGHEDTQGAFRIEAFSVENVSWLLDAQRPTEPPPEPDPPPPPPTT